jgi:O-antigen/teichoic acid export membrane protein
MRISAFSFAATGIFVVPEALLTRELRFATLAAIELSALVAGCVVAIAAAAAGAGPFALAWQAVTVAFVEAVLGLALVRPSLRPFSWGAFADLRRFGLSQLGFNSVNYWMRNADNVIVGHTFGSSALGAYARAYSILLLPVEQLSSAIGRVVFPSLSRMGDDRGRVRDAYLRVVSLTVVVAAPIGAGMALTAEPLVRTLLGDNWLAAIPIVRVLGGLAVIQTLGLSVGWIYQSQGRTDLQLRWGICIAPFVVGSFILGALWGSPLRVATAYAIVSTVLLVPSVQIPGKLVGLTIGDVFTSARPALVGCAAMGAVVLPFVQLSDALTPPVRLGIAVTLGAATYASALVVQRAAALADLRRLVRRSMNDR